MRKISALLLILVFTVSSIILVSLNYTSAAIPKPSVPEFTVKFVNASYSVTTTNPYTGLSETKLVSNNSIEITIKNQPFDYAGYKIHYDVRIKPHFADNWTEIYPIQNMTSAYNADGTFSYALYVNRDSPVQSSSSYTMIIFPVVPTRVYSASGYYEGYNIQRYYSEEEGREGRYSEFLSAIPNDAHLDFQVEALVGHTSQRWIIVHPLYPTYGGYFAPAVAYDVSSGWSETKTIIIPTSTTSPADSRADQTNTSALDQENRQTDLLPITLAVALIVAAVCLASGLLIYRTKRHLTNTSINGNDKTSA
ncbi:MAG: hypothetical protein QXU99_00420 [Candidatus Bathyarchaeia archaeon]